MTSAVIDGFESPLGLEALATVHWLLVHERVPPSLPELKNALARWVGGKSAGKRKLRLFDDELIELSVDRVTAGAA